jgi:hypothetical protein
MSHDYLSFLAKVVDYSDSFVDFLGAAFFVLVLVLAAVLLAVFVLVFVFVFVFVLVLAAAFGLALGFSSTLADSFLAVFKTILSIAKRVYF